MYNIVMVKEEDRVFKELLRESFSQRQNFKYSSGTEGKAFFLDNNFVLKCYEFCAKGDEQFESEENRFLLQYGQDIQQFNQMGLRYPKIYSYDIFYEGGKKYFCVLQQRMDGRQIFYSAPLRAYSLFKELMSEEEFFKVFEYGQMRQDSYDQVMKAYAEDFIKMNERFLSLPESAIQDYIVSVYNILKFSKKSFPDLASGNVIIGEDTLSIIDNAMLNSPDSFLTEDELMQVTMLKISKFFTACNSVNCYKRGCYPSRFDRRFFEDVFLPLVDKNKVLSKLSIERLYRVANSCLENPQVTPGMKEEIRKYTLLAALEDTDMANEVCEQIHQR